MLGKNRRVKVLDFGPAKAMDVGPDGIPAYFTGIGRLLTADLTTPNFAFSSLVVPRTLPHKIPGGLSHQEAVRRVVP
jgi:hypothetical protein